MGPKVNVFRPSFSQSYSHRVNNFTVVHLNSPAIIMRDFVLPEMWDEVSVVVRTKEIRNSKSETRNKCEFRIANRLFATTNI